MNNRKDWEEFIMVFGQDRMLYDRLEQVKIDLGINWKEIKKLLDANVDLSRDVISIT